MSEGNAKTLSVIAHLSALFSSAWISIVVPLVILLVSEDDVVKANARESLNFQISVILWSLIGFLLIFAMGVGFVVLAVVVVASVIMPIIAALRAAGDTSRAYQYPLVFRFLRG
jgi:uncharacterized Tic20 family protein